MSVKDINDRELKPNPSSLQWSYYQHERDSEKRNKSVNEIVMESKYGKKKSSSSTSSLFYEAPLGYSIEDVRPNGGIKKFKSLSTPTALRGHPEL
ncbi:hypothetical protein DY000_02037305 [Brassica cretica]|uniref:DUF4005 domain-containing protein n=1 Tax=Brassica cretica TaxID=69181 RepID=A0ABQ7BB96_BRACR|nr:hypothetical protein DY000_02037305 [Brassica cretica]